MSKYANSLFVEDSNLTKILLTIENETVELSEGDFIEFKRKGIIEYAKILSFGWHNSSEYVNRIFFLPWRVKESRWATTTIPMRGMPLQSNFYNVHLSDPSQERQSLCDEPYGDWTTIKKLNELPKK